MTKGSNASGNSASKTVATCGYACVVPAKTTVSFNGSKGGEGNSYQTTSRVSYGDKQSGCYERATTTEKASTGDFQWKNGTTGTRSEYKQTSTVRVGDNSGYTEVHSEQRVRNVTYNKSSVSSSSSSSSKDYSSGSSNGKDYIIYDNGRGGRGYGGYF